VCTVPLESHLQSILSWLFLEMGSGELFVLAGLEQWSSWSLLPKKWGGHVVSHRSLAIVCIFFPLLNYSIFPVVIHRVAQLIYSITWFFSLSSFTHFLTSNSESMKLKMENIHCAYYKFNAFKKRIKILPNKILIGFISHEYEVLHIMFIW
jgi:hypothetical protein